MLTQVASPQKSNKPSKFGLALDILNTGASLAGAGSKLANMTGNNRLGTYLQLTDPTNAAANLSSKPNLKWKNPFGA